VRLAIVDIVEGGVVPVVAEGIGPLGANCGAVQRRRRCLEELALDLG
jgi:hypothetical protein